MPGGVTRPWRVALRRLAWAIALVCGVMWVLWFMSGWMWMQSSWPQASFILGGGRLIYGFGTEAKCAYFTRGAFSCGVRHGGPQWMWWEYRQFAVKSGVLGYATLTPFGAGLPVAAAVFWVVATYLRRSWSCRHCEYDLRGLPTLTCPECGTVNARRQARRGRRRMSDIAEAKKELRARLKGALAALTPEQRSARSAAACGRALAADLFPAGATVMLYAPMLELGEVDLRLLAEGLVARGCVLSVPRVDWKGGRVTPVRVANLTTDLVTDAGAPTRGMLGARADAAEVPAAALGVVVVPGLGYDERGHRIGRGGGFYDRFLGGLGPGSAVRVALVFDEQMVPEVPVEGHDAVVDVIVTPTRVVRVGA